MKTNGHFSFTNNVCDFLVRMVNTSRRGLRINASTSGELTVIRQTWRFEKTGTVSTKQLKVDGFSSFCIRNFGYDLRIMFFVRLLQMSSFNKR